MEGEKGMENHIDVSSVLDSVRDIRRKLNEAIWWIDCLCDTLKQSHNLSDADVQEVRHGRWVRFAGMKSHYFCDQCRRHVEDRTGKPWIAFPYCHCGAKMDEEAE